jgi:hypothetical protein
MVARKRGRLTLDVLLPSADNRQLVGVGGPGKEFWVFGTNYANDVDTEMLRRSSLEPGAWRIELSPKAADEQERRRAWNALSQTPQDSLL